MLLAFLLLSFVPFVGSNLLLKMKESKKSKSEKQDAPVIHISEKPPDTVDVEKLPEATLALDAAPGASSSDASW